MRCCPTVRRCSNVRSALARTIASKSPLAIAGSKLALNHARDHSTAAALQQMTLLQSAIFDSAEIAVAIAGWKDKQAAQFAALAAAEPHLASRCGAPHGGGVSDAVSAVSSFQPPPSARYSATSFCSCVAWAWISNCWATKSERCASSESR